MHNIKLLIAKFFLQVFFFKLQTCFCPITHFYILVCKELLEASDISVIIWYKRTCPMKRMKICMYTIQNPFIFTKVVYQPLDYFAETFNRSILCFTNIFKARSQFRNSIWNFIWMLNT